MTEISDDDIKKISKLARLQLTDADRQNTSNQVKKIINWVEELKEVNTDNIEVMTGVYNDPMRMEKDEISDGQKAEEILKNAPDAKYGYFATPKVIE
jgi:aspartyl-tRNA(Asn)/glutamyl-tRNA(Gln) amidotransferase subunit C